jgi:hypothetical protein
MRASLFAIALGVYLPARTGTRHPDEREDIEMTEEQGSATRDDEPKDQPQDMSASPESEGGDASGADSGEQDAKSEHEDEVEEAKEEVRKLEEEGPPEKLEDWPTGKAKYETFGGPEGDRPYNEGPEEKMGPADVRHREDGSVEVQGEEVDDPEEYKGEPIPGGPTDPDTPNLRMDKASPEDSSQNEGGSSDDDESTGEEEEK